MIKIERTSVVDHIKANINFQVITNAVYYTSWNFYQTVNIISLIRSCNKLMDIEGLYKAWQVNPIFENSCFLLYGIDKRSNIS